ncbi:MAG: hypothetical protein KDL87_19085, partial [Verrucomicrobiae bacterium]|nr:hypothetical protein [Verrucomicrobiae bacterium]
ANRKVVRTAQIMRVNVQTRQGTTIPVAKRADDAASFRVSHPANCSLRRSFVSPVESAPDRIT